MAENESIVLLVLTGALIMLSLALTVIFFVTQHRKKYLIQENELLRVKNETEQSVLKAVIGTQEEERTRIGLNLHDSIGVELAMIKLNLTKTVHFGKGQIDLAYFAGEMENLENAIDNIRSICKDLYPKTLQLFGFIKAFAGVINRLGDSGTIAAQFSSNLYEENLDLDFATKLDLYRVCQEVSNNLLKYSQCRRLQVEVTLSARNQMKIVFEHDGNEFLNEQADYLIQNNTGIGLKSIRNRVNLIKGEINYFRSNDKSLVEITVPLKNE